MKTSNMICTGLGENCCMLGSSCPSFPLGPVHSTEKFVAFANI